jgi:aminoglycoside phosphotransferase (APT) family kinase protein
VSEPPPAGEAETPLAGGDVNVGDQVVVRVGETVRRPAGPHTPAVAALLDHLERAGFEGAPRSRGIDERGRHVLTYVEGEAALPPIPSSDEACHALGALLRRMHDAQAGFVRPADAAWHHGPLAPTDGEVICHNDVFPPNVILRDGLPVALIDWDLCGPMPRLYDVASAANFWAPLAHEARARAFGLENDRAGERLRILTDGYGLAQADRAALLDVVAHRNRMGHEIHRVYGGVERRPGWREMWDAGSGDEILARSAWFEAHRAQLLRYLA